VNYTISTPFRSATKKILRRKMIQSFPMMV